MRLTETDTMNSNVKPCSLSPNGYCLRATTKYFHGMRQDELFADFGERIMVAADDKGSDSRFVKSAHLCGKKAGSLHRGLIAVIKIAGDHQGIDLLVQTQVDYILECLARGITNQLG